jgi:phage repressor protein C with HTH and peptisase S24 domain
MTPNERVKNIRELLNMTQGSFGEPLGFKWYKVKDIEAGKIKVSPAVATKIDNIYSFRFEWILTGEGPMRKDERLADTTSPQRQAIPTQQAFPASDFVLIRQVNGRISAGGGVLPDDSVDVQAAFRQDWIKRKGGKPENMSLIKVSGDSMEPTLLSGDLVLVDHGRNTIAAQGGIYAISIEDEIMIKRVQPAIPDKLLIISDNKQYPPYEVELDKVKINGKVIWYARELER